MDKCMIIDCDKDAVVFLTPTPSLLGLCNWHMHPEWEDAVQYAKEEYDCEYA